MRLEFCAVCGRRDGLEQHHFVPRSVGGSDDEQNMLTLCAACHSTMHEMRVGRRLNHAATIKSGLARAKAQGKRLGRPTVAADKEAAVRAALGAGNGILKTAAMVGIGTGTVQRIKREMAEAA
jgi:hypothetical protein